MLDSNSALVFCSLIIDSAEPALQLYHHTSGWFDMNHDYELRTRP